MNSKNKNIRELYRGINDFKRGYEPRSNLMSEVQSAIAKLKRYKSLGSDQSPAETIQAVGEILRSKIHKLINSIWNTEKLPDQWKESIIVPVHKKGDKTDCSNYRGISLLSTSCKILSNIVLSILSSYI
ncbi:hypothetical protein B7P43_G12866 [Cryptotermes secundus]|uniref:Reverse transcriptase domain-containing protein n=1 Tax=Cryptotermes secundus TaxID=105785 RepID=A0A2J7QP87_9NEOP|nr:hypothetical protein B7P43_G12866 [Cryptotermes secundus]